MRISVLVFATLGFVQQIAGRPSLKCRAPPLTCANNFTSISAPDYFAAINPGWNLGNTLDALPNEGSWNNPPAQAVTFDQIKAAGFKSVRIPVTYNDHFVSGSPEWKIDEKWLARVSEVVNMATERGLYVVTNIHHDSWNWADTTVATSSGGNLTALYERFSASWRQIGRTLGCTSSLVAFETINEPRQSNDADMEAINRLNELFLEAINGVGGHNSKRVVTLVGGNMDAARTAQGFREPKVEGGIKNPWGIQFHYYSPYDFIFNAWGKTTWGTPEEVTAMTNDLTNIRNAFPDTPLMIGEFSVAVSTEPGARWRHLDKFVQLSTSLNMSLQMWDNGEDLLRRSDGVWRDPTSRDIILHGVKGERNSLPEITTDASATSQDSGAYIWFKQGDAVADKTIKYQLNGNSIVGVKLEGATEGLRVGTDYVINGSDVTFTKGLLEKYAPATSEPGSKAKFVVSFSAGAAMSVELGIWDVPTLATTTTKAVTGADLVIPIKWEGLAKLATVKILRNDGVILFDDWTQWLGPLQQARGTRDNHFRFDDNSVIITSAAVNAVIAAGVATTFTFEFFPRVPGNSVNYTLTV